MINITSIKSQKNLTRHFILDFTNSTVSNQKIVLLNSVNDLKNISRNKSVGYQIFI